MTDKFNFQGKLLENDSRVLTEDVAFEITAPNTDDDTSSIISDEAGRTVRIPFDIQSITSATASIINPPPNVTAPGANVNLENGVLNLQFYNLKGDTGATGPTGVPYIVRHQIYSSSVYKKYDEWAKAQPEGEDKTFSTYITTTPTPIPIGYVIDDDPLNDKLGLSFFLDKGDKGVQGPKGDTGSVAGLSTKPGLAAPTSEFISGVEQNSSGETDAFIKAPVGISTSNLLDGFRLSADKGGTGLTVAPSMIINLGSTSAVDIFTEAPRPGVTGTLPITQGGTGLTVNPSMTINLESTDPANIFEDTSSPGVFGTLPVTQGGTGLNNHIVNSVLVGNGENALSNIQTNSGAFYAQDVNASPTFGTLPIAQGGTGADNAEQALTNLGVESRINDIIEDVIYIGATTPSTNSLTKIWIRTVPSENDGS